ncbi:MAG: photosystem I reaction center subunit PsaK [Synechococcus sp.]|nr:photosystem I reaction center subunit PsaK [Synechococcus sp.]
MSLALTLAAAVPATMEWSPKIAVVMIICNVLAIAIGKATIKHPSEGPALPMPDMFGGMGLPALLATTSFGHILGAGVILGLGSMGAI